MRSSSDIRANLFLSFPFFFPILTLVYSSFKIYLIRVYFPQDFFKINFFFPFLYIQQRLANEWVKFIIDLIQ